MGAVIHSRSRFLREHSHSIERCHNTGVCFLRKTLFRDWHCSSSVSQKLGEIEHRYLFRDGTSWTRLLEAALRGVRS